MTDLTLHLPLDLTKRHFVVGDIHGRYKTFLRLLESADYDPENDIIYTVGDMIDRGSQSIEVLEFFNQKNTFAIRGNHEVMAIDDNWLMVWLSNGGVQTGVSLTEHLLNEDWLRAHIKGLPYFIDVGDPDEEYSFRIVHACLPFEWSEEEYQHIINSPNVDIDGPLFRQLLWSRLDINKITKNIQNLKPNMDGIEINPNRSGRNVFAGHTPINNVISAGDVTFIDTWRSYSMSMVEAITMQEWTVKHIAEETK